MGSYWKFELRNSDDIFGCTLILQKKIFGKKKNRKKIFKLLSLWAF